MISETQQSFCFTFSGEKRGPTNLKGRPQDNYYVGFFF